MLRSFYVIWFQFAFILIKKISIVFLAITQAFVASVDAQPKKEKHIFSCEHCPMVWYSKLCQDIEGKNQ